MPLNPTMKVGQSGGTQAVSQPRHEEISSLDFCMQDFVEVLIYAMAMVARANRGSTLPTHMVSKHARAARACLRHVLQDSGSVDCQQKWDGCRMTPALGWHECCHEVDETGSGMMTREEVAGQSVCSK